MVFYLSALILSPLPFISLLLIEQGAYITEQGITGYENGTFYVFYLFLIVNMFLIFHFLTRLDLRIKYGYSRTFYLAYTITYILLLLYARATNPEFTRFNLFEYLPGPLPRLAIYITIGYLYVYIYSVFKEKSFSRKLVLLVVFLFTEILRGEQFGGLFGGSIIFLIATVLQQRQGARINLKENRRVIVGSGIIFFLLFGYIVYSKFLQFEYAIGFFNRVVLQQHVLWGTVNLLAEGQANPDLTPYFKNLFSFETFRTSPDYGLGQLMVALSGDYARGLIEGGARFTSGYPAILIYHFGYIGAFLLNPIFTYIFVWTIRAQFYLLNNYNVIVFIIGMKVLSTYMEIYSMGEYGGFNIKFFMAAWFLTMMLIFLKKRGILVTKPMDEMRLRLTT